MTQMQAINTDAASSWTLDNAMFAIKGGSITGHLAKLTDRYGFDGFGDAISAVSDADFIAAIQGVSLSCINMGKDLNYKILVVGNNAKPTDKPELFHCRFLWHNNLEQSCRSNYH